MEFNSGITEALWVDGTDLAHEKRNESPNAAHFSWMSTGEPIGYSNWYPGEPNHNVHPPTKGVEHCLEINYNQKWNDNNCDIGSRNFICQLPNQQLIAV